jgi:multimeric flavodoxin WrbA
MHILGINGSPRKNGNTSTLLQAILEGSRKAGAETTEAHLHSLNMKGCIGCLSCRTEKPGSCAQKDELSQHLEAVKSCDGLVVACPIYMNRVSGQMKLFVDRCYSLYISKPEGGYESAVPPGKTYALVISQGAGDADAYGRSSRWLAGMTGSGLGLNEVGRIIHTDSAAKPAKDDATLLREAHDLGRRLVEQTAQR